MVPTGCEQGSHRDLGGEKERVCSVRQGCQQDCGPGKRGHCIVNKLDPFTFKVKTLTYDNGKEFAEHATIDKQLGSMFYFAEPYAS